MPGVPGGPFDAQLHTGQACLRDVDDDDGVAHHLVPAVPRREWARNERRGGEGEGQAARQGGRDGRGCQKWIQTARQCSCSSEATAGGFSRPRPPVRRSLPRFSATRTDGRTDGSQCRAPREAIHFTDCCCCRRRLRLRWARGARKAMHT